VASVGAGGVAPAGAGDVSCAGTGGVALAGAGGVGSAWAASRFDVRQGRHGTAHWYDRWLVVSRYAVGRLRPGQRVRQVGRGQRAPTVGGLPSHARGRQRVPAWTPSRRQADGRGLQVRATPYRRRLGPAPGTPQAGSGCALWAPTASCRRGIGLLRCDHPASQRAGAVRPRAQAPAGRCDAVGPPAAGSPPGLGGRRTWLAPSPTPGGQELVVGLALATGPKLRLVDRSAAAAVGAAPCRRSRAAAGPLRRRLLDLAAANQDQAQTVPPQWGGARYAVLSGRRPVRLRANSARSSRRRRYDRSPPGSGRRHIRARRGSGPW
jgi:hypothetical protein